MTWMDRLGEPEGDLRSSNRIPISPVRSTRSIARTMK